MRALPILLVAALAATAGGCIVAVDDGPHHVAAVGHHHAYVYYPDWYAYSCTHCHEWWVLESGGWSRHASRPARFSVGVEVAYVHIDDDGPEPFRHFDKHRRQHPGSGGDDEHPGKGPPPGKGWRK